jgi:hypothetical protein
LLVTTGVDMVPQMMLWRKAYYYLWVGGSVHAWMMDDGWWMVDFRFQISDFRFHSRSGQRTCGG